MVLLEFSVVPLGVGESVGDYVARCVEIVENSGLNYELHSMGTIVEGDLDQVFGVLKQCVEALADDCNRVTVSAKMDYRHGREGGLKQKVVSVEQRLGHKLKTSP